MQTNSTSDVTLFYKIWFNSKLSYNRVNSSNKMIHPSPEKSVFEV